MKSFVRILVLFLVATWSAHAADLGGGFPVGTNTQVVAIGKLTFHRGVEGNRFFVVKAGDTTHVYYNTAPDYELASISMNGAGTCVTLNSGKRMIIFWIPVEYPRNKETSVEWHVMSDKEMLEFVKDYKP